MTTINSTLRAEGDLSLLKFRNPVIHSIKCWPRPFSDSLAQFKMFEIRVNDRGYAVDDILLLREWSPDTQLYTGRQVYRRVIHLEHLGEWIDLLHEVDYVVMGTEVMKDA